MAPTSNWLPHQAGQLRIGGAGADVVGPNRHHSGHGAPRHRRRRHELGQPPGGLGIPAGGNDLLELIHHQHQAPARSPSAAWVSRPSSSGWLSESRSPRGAHGAARRCGRGATPRSPTGRHTTTGQPSLPGNAPPPGRVAARRPTGTTSRSRRPQSRRRNDPRQDGRSGRRPGVPADRRVGVGRFEAGQALVGAPPGRRPQGGRRVAKSMMEYAVGETSCTDRRSWRAVFGPGHGLLDPAGDVVVAAARANWATTEEAPRGGADGGRQIRPGTFASHAASRSRPRPRTSREPAPVYRVPRPGPAPDRRPGSSGAQAHHQNRAGLGVEARRSTTARPSGPGRSRSSSTPAPAPPRRAQPGPVYHLWRVTVLAGSPPGER